MSINFYSDPTGKFNKPWIAQVSFIKTHDKESKVSELAIKTSRSQNW